MTDLTQAQIKFLQDRLKSQLEFADSLEKLNQNNPEIQENLSILEKEIQLLQAKLSLENLN